MKSKSEPFENHIAVWSILLPDHHENTDMCRALLNAEETARAEKFHKPADARNFVLSRALLRRVLADCLDSHPAAIRFMRNKQGKPFLKDRELEFNVSHSRDRLLIAVSAGRAVGIDIEFRREGINMDSIVRRWFAPAEQQAFQTSENKIEVFFDVWSKKEAYVKALGEGIYKDLNTFAVPIGGNPGSPLIGNDAGWFFQGLEIDPDYASAVVSQTPAVPVEIRDFQL